MLFFFSLLSIFILGYLWNFSKKVSMLLILEGIMLLLIFFSNNLYNFNMFSSFFLMLLTIFMVLDSVFGMSLLILSSRDSTMNSMIFMNL